MLPESIDSTEYERYFRLDNWLVKLSTASDHDEIARLWKERERVLPRNRIQKTAKSVSPPPLKFVKLPEHNAPIPLAAELAGLQPLNPVLERRSPRSIGD